MLKKLYRLQQLETAAAALDKERINSAEYRQLRTLRTVFEADKKKLAAVSSDISSLEKKISGISESRADLENRAAKEKGAMYDGSVTNPKELKARQVQLSSLEAKMEAADREKTRCLELLANKQEEAGKLRKKLTDIQTEFARIKDIYQLKQEERDARGKRLEEEKAAVLPELDAASLAWFESMREQFSGTPVACLDKRRICSGCHTMVPPPTYRRAAAGQRPLCEKCGRTLFVDD